MTKYLTQLFVIGIFLCFVGCTHSSPTIKHEKLFSLNLGVMGNEIDFFERDGTLLFDKKIEILLKNNLFYISNPSIGKIMKFSNYGDILSFIYNENYNLPFKQDTEHFQVTTWNFQNIGSIDVDSEGMLYVDNHIEIDANLTKPITYDRIILRFDSQGNYKDFLGQNGRGSKPFPYISHLSVTKDDNLIVLTRTADVWKIFSYDKNGDVLFAPFDIPNTLTGVTEQPELSFSITDIKVDPSGDFLFIFATGLIEDKTEIQPRIFMYDIKQTKIVYNFPTPITKEGQTFDFIGCDGGQNLYFIRNLEQAKELQGYELAVLNIKGIAIKNTNLTNTLRENPVFRSLSVDPQGVIYALFVEQTGAEIVWWQHILSPEEKNNAGN